jgi:hypothetical protein
LTLGSELAGNVPWPISDNALAGWHFVGDAIMALRRDLALARRVAGAKTTDSSSGASPTGHALAAAVVIRWDCQN